MKKRYVFPRMKVVEIELERSALDVGIVGSLGDNGEFPQLIDEDKNWGDDEDGIWRNYNK